MENPLTYLKRRAGEDWLIGYDSNQFNRLTEELFGQLTQLAKEKSHPKILLAEQNPLKFLASFLAAVAAGCPIFLCNPQWGQQEWQQVFDLVQPDLILGHLSLGINKEQMNNDKGQIIPNPPLKPPFSLGNLSPRLPVSPSPRLFPRKGGSQPGFSMRGRSPLDDCHHHVIVDCKKNC